MSLVQKRYKLWWFKAELTRLNWPGVVALPGRLQAVTGVPMFHPSAKPSPIYLCFAFLVYDTFICRNKSVSGKQTLSESDSLMQFIVSASAEENLKFSTFQESLCPSTLPIIHWSTKCTKSISLKIMQRAVFIVFSEWQGGPCKLTGLWPAGHVLPPLNIIIVMPLITRQTDQIITPVFVIWAGHWVW